jgi:hypothetical protein
MPTLSTRRRIGTNRCRAPGPILRVAALAPPRGSASITARTRADALGWIES